MEYQYPGVVAGGFKKTPQGVILHGSRSGAAGNTTVQEYLGTARYAVNEPGGLGWNATVGDDQIAMHMLTREWGWNARGCSSLYLAIEFAQAVEAKPISDAQVRAFCWFVGQARKQWPNLPLHFPTHAEIDGIAAYGTFDGKSDVFHKGSAATDELRGRITTELTARGVT